MFAHWRKKPRARRQSDLRGTKVPECPIGRNVHAVLGTELGAAEAAMLDRMASTTVADLANETRKRIAQQKAGINETRA